MPYVGWNGQRPCHREAGDPDRPHLVTGGTAHSLLPGLDAQQTAMAAAIPACRRWLSNGGGHPAMLTHARGFRRAADDFLAAARF